MQEQVKAANWDHLELGLHNMRYGKKIALPKSYWTLQQMLSAWQLWQLWQPLVLLFQQPAPKIHK